MLKTRYKKCALIFLVAVIISLIICLALSRLFEVNLPFTDLLVMSCILIVLKLMNKLLNLPFFKPQGEGGEAGWLKRLLEMLVVTFCLIFILSGLSLIGYETISFKKSLLLVVAAVPGIEFFLFMRRYVIQADSGPATTDPLAEAAAAREREPQDKE